MPQQADPSQLTPASQVCSGPLPSPSEPNLISPPKSEPSHAAHARQKKSPHTIPKKQRVPLRSSSRDETSVMHRASQREMPRTGKSKPLSGPMHSNLRELQAKKKMLMMINMVHLRGGLVFPVTVTHGLKLGRSWSRQTNSEESDPIHQRPSSTNSFFQSIPRKTNSNLTLQTKRQVGTTGKIPRRSIQGGWFRAGSCKAQENLPILVSYKKTRPISNKYQWSSDQANGSRGRTSTNPSQGQLEMR